jgi:alginate O-acetyltransferase complex protein AlgI
MLFNSLEFLIFFPIVLILYFSLRERPRVFLLLVASCIFYMAFVPGYVLILFTVILVDYFAGLRMEKSQGREKKLYLLLSIGTTCAILFFFKYFNFAMENLSAMLGLLGSERVPPKFNILLPIGLSFHTFQSLSYVIEVYLGRQKAEKDLAVYSLYVMFFPQLVAGPIERPQNLIHQFREPHPFDPVMAAEGLRMMLWGFFKKIFIADRLAIVVNEVFAAPEKYDGPTLVIASIFFALQVYCDFSGYSEIAIGSARIMGVRLMKNFDFPYFSRSVAEFWRRWHISLSSWFKDYIYIPLGGSRVSPPRHYTNMILVFLISGLWHGAAWTYIIWGGLQGVYLVLGDLTKALQQKFYRLSGIASVPYLQSAVEMGLTFVLIVVGLIFFRAESLGDALFIISHLASDWTAYAGLSLLSAQLQDMGLPARETLVLSFGALVFLLGAEMIVWRRGIAGTFLTLPIWVRFPVYSAAIWAILLFGVLSENKFVYFIF